MPITLVDVNRVTLRVCFLPWFRRTMADLGIKLPDDWNPSDEELDRLARRVADAFREDEDAPTR